MINYSNIIKEMNKILRECGRLILFIMLIFVILGTTTIMLNNEIMHRFISKNSTEMLSTAEANINTILKEPEGILTSSSYAIRNIIEKGNDSLYKELSHYMIGLTDWLMDGNGISGFNGIYGELKGKFLDGTKWTPPSDYVVQSRPWYIEAKDATGKIVVTDPYIDAQTSEVVISYSVELFDGKGYGYGKTLGVLAIDMQILSVSELVTNLKLSSGGYGILLDQNYNILAHADKSFIGSNYIESNSGIKRTFLDNSSDVSKIEFVNENGIKCIGEYKKMQNGWILGLITPINSYLSEMHKIIKILFILFAFAMLILIFITVRITNMNQKSKEEKEIAVAANEAKSNFLATISHEIRTPMNAIIGVAQIELLGGGLMGKRRAAMDKIYMAGNGLLGIINNLLDLSKIESGKMELNPSEYDVPSLINDIVQLNIVKINSKPIEFLLDVSEKLPVKLFGDELRLKQILTNILSNSFKYTQKGKVKLSISAEYTTAILNEEKDLNRDKSLTRANGHAVILKFIVSDTGQGMKPNDLKKLFSEYSRFNEKANRTTEGTGLGLNITKKLVVLMNGKIDVESEYGKGSSFTVRVPQELVDEQIIGASCAKKLCEYTFYNDKENANFQIIRQYMPYGKVLIVDDVETNLYVAEGLIAPYGIKVEMANSGFEALDKINAGNSYDIIFLDHMMPEMDGIETIRKIKKMNYEGIIIALTANAVVGNDKILKENGFDDFLSKPIDIRQLNAVLNKYVKERHKEEAADLKNVVCPVVNTGTASAKLLEAFARDATKAIATLKEAAVGDLGLFITTAHAMKSALANIGENDLSALAKELEKAGRNGDKEFISANADSFILKLKETVISLNLMPEQNQADGGTTGTESIKEDTDLLKQKLQEIISACENFDDDEVLNAVKLLLEKKWNVSTLAALNEIRYEIFSNSDFDKAKEIAEKLA